MNTKTLIELAEAWASHNELRLSTVSTYAANDGKFFGRLKLGSGCTLSDVRVFGTKGGLN